MNTTLLRICTILITVFTILAMSGCTTTDNTEKPLVAATFFPYYDLAKAIAGEHANVYSVVPPTTEPHSFEPSPRDIMRLERTSMYIATGVELEQFEKVLLNAVQNTAIIVNGSAGIAFLAADHHHHEDDRHDDEHHDEHEHDEHHEEDRHDDDEHHDEHEEDHHDHETGIDPHVWLSPINAKVIAQNIYQGFLQLDSEHASSYEQNKQQLISDLDTLDNAYRERLATCEKDVVLVAHNAYQYLAKEYGFKAISIAGLSHESEPTPRQMAHLIDEAHEHGINVVFFEELVDPRVAEAIAQEVGAETMALSPVEGSLDGKGYIQIMYDNLDKLAYALICS